MLPPHWHSRASNYVVTVLGSVTTYMWEENGARLVTEKLTPGKMTIFPQGSMHMMVNTGELSSGHDASGHTRCLTVEKQVAKTLRWYQRSTPPTPEQPTWAKSSQTASQHRLLMRHLGGTSQVLSRSRKCYHQGLGLIGGRRIVCSGVESTQTPLMRLRTI